MRLIKAFLITALLIACPSARPSTPSTLPLTYHGLADLTSGFHDVDCIGNRCVFTYGHFDVPAQPVIDVGLIEVAGKVHGARCEQGRCEFIN